MIRKGFGCFFANGRIESEGYVAKLGLLLLTKQYKSISQSRVM